MLSLRWQNPQKNENTQTSEVNSNFFLEICWKHDTSLQSRGIHYSSALIPFYHYLFSRYLVLADHHFSSDILVPFPIRAICAAVVQTRSDVQLASQLATLFAQKSCHLSCLPSQLSYLGSIIKNYLLFSLSVQIFRRSINELAKIKWFII